MKLLAKACELEASCPAIYDDGKNIAIIGKFESFRVLPAEAEIGWDEEFVIIPKSLFIKAAASLIAEASVE